MKALLSCILLLASATAAFGDTDDDTLQYYLSKSNFVVMGEIVSEPAGASSETGVIHYGCNFKVSQAVRGFNRGGKKDEIKADSQIKVDIIRFEMNDADKCPEIKKGGKCILFVKEVNNGTPVWKTADFWFGVQRASPWMMRSLARLTDEIQSKEGKSAEDAEDSPISTNPHFSDKNPNAVSAAKELGSAAAAKDIKKGVFRILYFGQPRSADKPLVDDVTGYRVQIVAGCTVSSPFVAEVEAYNDAMRDFHDKSLSKAKPN